MSKAKPALRVGLMPAISANDDADRSQRQLIAAGREAAERLGRATGLTWNFEICDPLHLEGNESRAASDFLSEASHQLVEESLDLVVVVTGVTVVSEEGRAVAGAASPLTRTCIISTKKIGSASRGKHPGNDKGTRQQQDELTSLLLNLIGHCLGLPLQARRHLEADAAPASEGRLRRLAEQFAEREYHVSGWWAVSGLHAIIGAKHLGKVAKALWHNKAPLLPLKMPGLATAAVAPTFLLVFTAEFWDAGLGMGDSTAWLYALISILGATLYLSFVQNLFLPRKSAGVVTEHLAVANVVIFLTMFLAIVGLFLMVALLMLAIELWVFPPGLIGTWPTLQQPDVTLADKFRLAVFISTIGITTGALAGGLERRNVLQGLALFRSYV